MDPVTAAVIGVGYACLEYWLGKTDKVKPGSLVEAVIYSGMKILNVFRKQK